MRRLFLILAVGLAVSIVLAEALARLVLGLGDPPLTVLDPEMEYRFAPNQDVRRFGNRVAYNQWSMRSDPVDIRKADPRELRVLVLGDSVINGGALTDQSRLATTLAEQALSSTNRPARGLNVSAGSWGPENQLAYVRKFGLFDADAVILVLSTHDMADVMTFPTDLGPNSPTERPLLATAELLTRYLPRYLPVVSDSAPAATDALSSTSATMSEAVARSRQALRELVAHARAAQARVYVVHHPEREEDFSLDHPLRTALEEVAAEAEAPLLPMAPILGPVGARGIYYRDEIHINDAGQKVYAQVIVCLAELKPEDNPAICTQKPVP